MRARARLPRFGPFRMEDRGSMSRSGAQHACGVHAHATRSASSRVRTRKYWPRTEKCSCSARAILVSLSFHRIPPFSAFPPRCTPPSVMRPSQQEWPREQGERRRSLRAHTGENIGAACARAWERIVAALTRAWKATRSLRTIPLPTVRVSFDVTATQLATFFGIVTGPPAACSCIFRRRHKAACLAPRLACRPYLVSS
jgi:hypothetical protein